MGQNIGGSTRVGKLELRVPQDRAGRFSTELFERYQRSEPALVATLAEMYVQGVSTRKVKAIGEELCGHAFSASSISAIKGSKETALEGAPGKGIEALVQPLDGVHFFPHRITDGALLLREPDHLQATGRTVHDGGNAHDWGAHAPLSESDDGALHDVARHQSAFVHGTAGKGRIILGRRPAQDDRCANAARAAGVRRRDATRHDQRLSSAASASPNARTIDSSESRSATIPPDLSSSAL